MSFTKPDSYCTEKSTTRASSGLDDVEVFLGIQHNSSIIKLHFIPNQRCDVHQTSVDSMNNKKKKFKKCFLESVPSYIFIEIP